MSLRRNSGAGSFPHVQWKTGTFLVGKDFPKPNRVMSPSFAGSELQLPSTTLSKNSERQNGALLSTGTSNQVGKLSQNEFSSRGRDLHHRGLFVYWDVVLR